MSAPKEFTNVTATTKANVYFDGKVVSHALVTASGDKITLGVILPGTYNFGTAAPERMQIIAGACRVKLKDATDWTTYKAGDSFNVPGDSSFDIVVDAEITEYVCSYG